VPLAAVAGLLTGGLVGWVNGTLVGRVKLPPFIVTLGTMSLARGIAIGLTGGWPVRNLPQGFRTLGQHNLPLGSLPLPLPVLFMLGLAVLLSLLMSKTVLGSYIYTLASNERALLTSGVNVVQIKVLVYTLCGALTAIGGLLMTARLGVAAPTAAVGYELDIIAAAVIGGISLFGGEGSILGVLLGAAVMQMVRNGLVLLGFSVYWQTAALGTMILAFILLDHWRRQIR
jgi:ribose transport system permease protein